MNSQALTLADARYRRVNRQHVEALIAMARASRRARQVPQHAALWRRAELNRARNAALLQARADDALIAALAVQA